MWSRPAPERVPTRKRQWMIEGRDGDPLDTAHPDALNPGDGLIERPADPDRGCAVDHICLTAPSASM
jgi:hypothetical protein